MNDTKFRAKIIAALRKLTYSWTPRNEVKNAAKVAPATFECAECGTYCYTGTSEGKEKILTEELNHRVEKRKVHIDHIDPILDPKLGFVDWNSYIDRMFCEASGLQVLCSSCHDRKTKRENSERQANRRRLKKEREKAREKRKK